MNKKDGSPNCEYLLQFREFEERRNCDKNVILLAGLR